MAIRSNNYGSKPVSPALRNIAFNSHGLIQPFPALGEHWDIELTIRRFTNQSGYALSISGAAPGKELDRSHSGILVGFTAPNLVEWYHFTDVPDVTPGVPNDIQERFPFPSGKKNKENHYHIRSRPGQPLEFFLNGLSVGTKAITNAVNTVGNGFKVGYYFDGNGNYKLLARYDNIKVAINGNPIIDIDFEDGIGANKVTAGTYDMQLINGATIFPQPAGPATSSNGVIGATITDYI